MVLCQVGHAKWLGEICGGLADSEGKLRHLGLPTAPSRSTLAYANEHRPWQLQQTIFEQLLAKCQILVASQPETRKKYHAALSGHHCPSVLRSSKPPTRESGPATTTRSL